MSLSYRVLGQPGRDNALLVEIDSGQAVERLLFDCGDGCLTDLAIAETQAIDGLFFSHLHMDHVAGFDHFFRCNYSGTAKPNRIWGPPETASILQHRFQGFLWNLHEELDATWFVSDVRPNTLQTASFELREAFSIKHDRGNQPYERIIAEGTGFAVEAVTMDHRTPSLAYVVRERPRRNIDVARLATLGLTPGPWLKQLKDRASCSGSVELKGVTYSLAELQRALVVETPGESIAYLTDFLMDDIALAHLSETLQGCRTVVCEGQYRHADEELARRNFHMTTVLAATLARRAGAEELVLFHLSDRYDRAEWAAMLQEAREIFPNVRYPEAWNLTLRP